MSEREQRLRRAYEAFDRGDMSGFRELFSADARWLGIEGSGWDGDTPT